MPSLRSKLSSCEPDAVSVTDTLVRVQKINSVQDFSCSTLYTSRNRSPRIRNTGDLVVLNRLIVFHVGISATESITVEPRATRLATGDWLRTVPAAWPGHGTVTVRACRCLRLSRASAVIVLIPVTFGTRVFGTVWGLLAPEPLWPSR